MPFSATPVGEVAALHPGSHMQSLAQQIVEPEGCDCSQGTIWLDPLPDDCRSPAKHMPPPAEP